MVEVLHYTGGEIIPRRVLCPWRAHLLASTLPAVARATAACFVRCAWMIGRGLGLPRASSSGWCVRCSPHEALAAQAERRWCEALAETWRGVERRWAEEEAESHDPGSAQRRRGELQLR